MAATFMMAVPAALGHPEPTADGAISDGGERDAHLHGDGAGHLAPKLNDVRVVGRTSLKNVVPGKIADVGVLKGYAYLASWGVENCTYNGVHVVDMRVPATPREVAFIQSKEGSYPGEGVQALSISTPRFTGDILVTNNEKCKDKAGFGGLNIYDVTNPRRPTPLVEGLGDSTVNGQGKKDANEIHSVFAWDAGDKAYAVIVDNEELADVDIIDITDPKKARFIAEYDLAAMFPQIVQPSMNREVFNHDVIVKQIDGKQIMSVSYWDGGYVLLDMTNPLAPIYLGDSDFSNPDRELLAQTGSELMPEGNGHQSEFTLDNEYLIGADEDFSPYITRVLNIDDVSSLDVSAGSRTPPLEPGDTIAGTSVYVGLGCTAGSVPPAPSIDAIAVVERGVCSFTQKVAAVEAAGGYEAVLIFNRTGADGGCESTLSMDVDGGIPTFGVAPRSQGFALFDLSDPSCTVSPLPVPIGTQGDRLTFSSAFDGWGYVRLFDATPGLGGKLNELDTFAIPEAMDEDFATGFGDLSVHEVATSQVVANRLYLSYYSGGFRVLEIHDDKLVEVGAYIGPQGSNFWGVEVFQMGGKEYVAASDRDYGLIIFEYDASITPD